MRVIFIYFIFLVSQNLYAYVFDMRQTQYGSYLRSSVSPWANGQTPWSQSSGTSVAWSDQFTNIWNYEFGFLYNSKSVTWRFGVEITQPPQLNGMVGSDTVSTTPYYSMMSSVSAVTPKIGMEINLRTWKDSRIWAYIEYGLANLTIQNSYNFTAAGTVKYGIANFREEVKSTQSKYSASLGYEVLATDTTTISLELGYQTLLFNNLTHNQVITNFQGPVTVGSAAK